MKTIFLNNNIALIGANPEQRHILRPVPMLGVFCVYRGFQF